MKAFFDAVRPMFRRKRLSQLQVEGMTAIIDYGVGMPRSHLAKVLATAFHETGQRMQPVREGFTKTNTGAIRAVTGLFNKGIISRNYALPHTNGLSYYGRGLVQITHLENYLKFGIAAYPEKAMEMGTSLDIMFKGMTHGMFRKGYSLSMIPIIPTIEDFIEAREIINGDKRKNGRRIAEVAIVFYNALLLVEDREEFHEMHEEVGEEPHTLWCQLLDLIGLGDHSDTGA
jgi:hypothetical protein